jgi:uncharacterized protein
VRIRTLSAVDLTAPEIRVLGCLLEKQRLTPDAYPLSLNSLRLATNQSTSRDPVVDYDESTIRHALDRLYRRRWARLASTSGRASKYRHLLDDALGLPEDQLVVLTVLMLRGSQTPGELRARTERMYRFEDGDALEAALDGLAARELVLRLDRRPGQKEERYAHRLGEDAPDAPEPPAPQAAAPPPPAPQRDVAPPPAPRDPSPPPVPRDSSPAPAVDEERLAKIESDIAALRAEIAALRDALGG